MTIPISEKNVKFFFFKAFADVSRVQWTVFSKRGWHPQPIHGQPDAVLSGASSQKFAEKTMFQKVLVKRVPLACNTGYYSI
jgi:hypothetical protein